MFFYFSKKMHYLDTLGLTYAWDLLVVACRDGSWTRIASQPPCMRSVVSQPLDQRRAPRVSFYGGLTICQQ